MKVTLLDVLKNRLSIAEANLKKYQLDFAKYVQDHIHDGSFERNAMQYLLVMQEEKAKIETLKLNIDLLENSK
jgi:hypothetical protein